VISLHELYWQDNRRIKCALSTLRAHFYVISFTKSDLSIISTTFNAVDGSLRHQDYQAYYRAHFAYGIVHEIRAKAYLDMVYIFSSHDLYSRYFVQSHNNVLRRPKTKEDYLSLGGWNRSLWHDAVFTKFSEKNSLVQEIFHRTNLYDLCLEILLTTRLEEILVGKYCWKHSL